MNLNNSFRFGDKDIDILLSKLFKNGFDLSKISSDIKRYYNVYTDQYASFGISLEDMIQEITIFIWNVLKSEPEIVNEPKRLWKAIDYVLQNSRKGFFPTENHVSNILGKKSGSRLSKFKGLSSYGFENVEPHIEKLPFQDSRSLEELLDFAAEVCDQKEYEILEDHIKENLSMKDIAKKRGISVQYCYSLYNRALKNLKNLKKIV